MATELEAAEQQLAYWQTIVDYLRKREKPRPTRDGVSRNGTLTARQAAEQALRDAGRPLRTRDLLAAVQEAGARMKDADGLTKTLMRHRTVFVRAGRGEWTLAPHHD